MSRLAHDEQTCPRGEDQTTDPASLDPLTAQGLVNFNLDKMGVLSGQIQLSDILLTDEPFAYPIQGIGYLNKIEPGLITHTLVDTPPALLAVLTGDSVGGHPQGQVYVYSQDEPATFPPTFSTLVTHGTFFMQDQKARFLPYLKNMYVFQDNNLGNAFQPNFNGVIWQDGTVSTQQGISVPPAVTTGSGGGSPSKFGVVQYCITLVDVDGFESSPNTTPTVVDYGGSPTNLQVGDVLVASLTGMLDHITSVNFYATLGNGNTFYKIGTVAATNTTTFEDDSTDAEVQAGNVMPHFGQNDPPLPASFGCIHKNRMWLNISGTNQIQCGNYGSGTQFNSVGVLVNPATGLVINATDGFNITVGTEQSDVTVGMCSIGSVLLVFNRLGTYVIQGNDLTDFAVYPVLTARGEPVGCVSPDSIARCGVGQNEVWFTARDGVYAVDGGLNINKVSQPEQVAFDNLNTPAGIINLSDCSSWYSQHKYHLSIPGSSTVYFFDFNHPGVSRWGRYDISALTGNTNAALMAVCLGIPYNAPTFIFLARSDQNKVQMWDVITQNVTVNGMVWQGRPMQSFLPYKERAAMGEQEPRAGRKRIRRMFVFGEGTLTAGGTVSMITDGHTETWPVPTGTGFSPRDGILIYQEWTPNTKGYLQTPKLVLNGTGIKLRQLELQYEFVG